VTDDRGRAGAGGGAVLELRMQFQDSAVALAEIRRLRPLLYGII
jgi:hypothetical protein